MFFTDIGAMAGDSGSPFFNEQGRVTGIVFFGVSDLSGSGAFTLTGAIKDFILQVMQ